jgi:outer membrane protein TolC
MKRSLIEGPAILALMFCSVLGARASTDLGLVSFDQAVEQILVRSTDLASERAQVSETYATNIPARMAFLPSIGVQLSRVANQDNILLNRTVSDSVNINGKLNLFRFGADVKGWQVANGTEEAEMLRLSDTVLKAEQNAVQGLVSEIQGLLETEVLSGIVKKEQELLKIGRERFTRGLMPQQEVDKIAVDMENASSRLTDTQVRETVARSNLIALLGHAQVKAGWPWVDRLRE